jgi:hypothetical protein
VDLGQPQAVVAGLGLGEQGVRSTSAASTASITRMSPPGGSCGTEPMRMRPVRLMSPPSASTRPGSA